MKSDDLPASCRPLQMIHGFDQWPEATDEGMRERILALKQAGLGGLVVNVSFKNYLRDEAAWIHFKRGVLLAHQEGMRLWIYDEEGYPSGAAGGRVLEEAPSTEAQGLIRIVEPTGGIRYDVIRLYEGTHATENFYQKRPCINMLDPLGTATFLAVTHDRYAAVLEPIAQYVEAFFTDEPALISAYIPKDRDYPKTLPWHARLPDEFMARMGYDLRPHLESLFVDTGGIDRKFRCDFYAVVAALCAETYFGGLREWCRRHGVASSGHLLGEESMAWQTVFNGEPYACYRQLDIPGIDMITSDPEKIMANEYFLVPKVAGSACRLQGSRRLMCEISDFFGVMDQHHASIEQMQCTAGILFAGGVTDLCSYYTIAFKPEDEEKPGKFSVRTYRRYTDFVTRLNACFTRGTIETRVAVLYPIVALHAHFTPSTRSMYEPHVTPVVNNLDSTFTHLCRSLLQQQIDFDVVDETSMAGARVEGKFLRLGERGYQVLILPPMDTIRVKTMETIAGFAEAGGAVVTHPLVPKYAAEGPENDGRINAAVSRIQASGSFAYADDGATSIGALVKARVPAGCELTPPSEHILCTVLNREGGTTYFLVNTSSNQYVGNCTVRSAGVSVLYDPATGEARPLPQQKADGECTEFSLTLRPFESLMVEFN
ncbi:MAG: hypothetical protein IPN11_15810 [Opitutaceae bacterium]|nr:hypothetical protein [Opitutaceae bacterium]